jgi:hypothetical protein
MAMETLGEACSQGWRVTVRCSYGRSESPRSQSSRECNYRKELDMETLVWTRGRGFPRRAWKAVCAARAADRGMSSCSISHRVALRCAEARMIRGSANRP